MARPAGVSQEIVNMANQAHELINRKRNPMSVRKACDQAGLSIASYYKVHPSTAGEPTGTTIEATVKKEARKARKSRRAISGSTANLVNVSRKSENVTDLKNYIAKLEHRIVRLTLEKDEE